jgi:hypothetical protein
MDTPRDAQASMGIGDLTFSCVSKQHILFHCTLQSGNQSNDCFDRMMGGCGTYVKGKPLTMST